MEKSEKIWFNDLRFLYKKIFYYKKFKENYRMGENLSIIFNRLVVIFYIKVFRN